MEKMLEVNNLTKKFGGLIAVNDVSMYVEKGEIVGLIGANGAGKTTLFNMIAGEFPPTSGTILFNGKEVQGKKGYQMCHMGIARTYQIVKPFSNLTVLDNTAVGAMLKDRNINRAKEKAREIIHLVGLDYRIDVNGADLNLPELKRLELARALATEPQLLLMDEAMAGLNPSDSDMMIDLVKKINSTGVTIVIIEHVMKAIMRLSHRIYVLNQGRLVAKGTPEEVSNDPEVIKSYFGEKRYAKN